MLELPTVVPELEDSAKAAPLFARVTAKVLIFKSFTFTVKFCVTVLVPSVAVRVNE